MASSVQTILQRNRLFRGLSAAIVQQVSALAVRRFYEDGAIAFSRGEPGDAHYGLVTGRVRISASTREGKEMFLNIMEPGDTFGEIALLDGNPRTATASATVRCELMIIPRAQFRALAGLRVRRRSESVETCNDARRQLVGQRNITSQHPQQGGVLSGVVATRSLRNLLIGCGGSRKPRLRIPARAFKRRRQESE